VPTYTKNEILKEWGGGLTPLGVEMIFNIFARGHSRNHAAKTLGISFTAADYRFNQFQTLERAKQQTGWTADRIEALRTLWSRKKTVSEIAQTLNTSVQDIRERVQAERLITRKAALDC
jgi:hypothetical protein